MVAHGGSGTLALLCPFLGMPVLPYSHLFFQLQVSGSAQVPLLPESLPLLGTPPLPAGAGGTYMCPGFLPLTMFELVIYSLNYSEPFRTD